MADEELTAYVLLGLFTIIVIFISYKISKRIQGERRFVPKPSKPRTSDASTLMLDDLPPGTPDTPGTPETSETPETPGTPDVFSTPAEVSQDKKHGEKKRRKSRRSPKSYKKSPPTSE